jgi:predicted kinase
MRKVYIMRGVPGSGKSTLARTLVGDEGVIHSTDSFFEVDGIYVFDGTKLEECHQRNLAAFRESLKNGVPIVICDNTNVKRVHFEPYVAAAREFDYEVEFKVMPHPDPRTAAERNVHGVGLAIIQRMIRAWED